jgi:protein SCO1
MRLASRVRSVARMSPALALGVIGLWLGTSCSRAAKDAPLSGHTLANSAPVGALALPEVHADGSSTPFPFRAQSGHVLVVYFGYTTCPDVCPTTLGDLHLALAKLGADAQRVDVAFVTVDRDRDTPDRLVPYITTFVTGGHALRPASETELATAENAFGAMSSITHTPAGEIEVSHSGTVYLVDQNGKIVDEWSFGSTPELMAHDLRILVARAPTRNPS